MNTFLYKVFIMAKHGWHWISRTQDASYTPPFHKKQQQHWLHISLRKMMGTEYLQKINQHLKLCRVHVNKVYSEKKAILIKMWYFFCIYDYIILTCDPTIH